MRIINTVLIIALLISVSGFAKAQGCSDAGFCTMNSLKPNQADSVSAFHNQIKAGISYGLADHDITAIAGYIEYHREINKQFSLDLKITTLSQSGNGISVSGLSDLLLAGNYSPWKGLTFTIGGKFPLVNTINMYKGEPMSMDYQSTLGTIDLIAGIGLNFMKFQVVVAIQSPLKQSGNEYIRYIEPDLIGVSVGDAPLEDYTRTSDVLMRLSYPIKLGKKMQISPSILPIYHVSNDKYSTLGSEFDIVGSKGLTLNLNAYFDYQLNVRNSIQFNTGFPLVVRDARPDGLTRSFIATLEYKYAF